MAINSIIFAFFIFANHMQQIFGNLTVLRGPIFYYHPHKVKLICLSKDDGSALIWNYNLIWNYYSPEKNNYEFQNLYKSNNEIDCKMNVNEDCLKLWITNDWTFTNSIKTPMGPVFDQRWENFEEYKNLEDIYDLVNFNLTAEVKLSFSVRVSRDTHMLICNGKNYTKDLCYWIIIGGWGNKKSVIRKCSAGVPQPGKWPPPKSTCAKEQIRYSHIDAPLSQNEWRSFVIMWNSTIGQIIVYDTDKIIMSYKDKEFFYSINTKYYMFIRSDIAMLIRFHIYDFLHTTIENAILTSPVFQFDNEICLQLLIGLCIECDAHIVLRTHESNKILAMTIVKGSLMAKTHGLPMWQSVKITGNISTTDYNAGIIQLIPKLNRNSSNPLWAIANVRQCPPNEALRKSIIISNQDWTHKDEYFWPTITCQKLFYDEQIVVDSLSQIRLNTGIEDVDCPEGKIGPQCASFCKQDLNSNIYCEGTEICYKNGCMCVPGFVGDTCSKPCEPYRYGYGCKKTCGVCFHKEQCNKINGQCISGCELDAEGIYIPPLCQISVDKPEKPSIISVNETTIWVAVPITWKDEYEGISILYSFIIQENQYNQQSWNKFFRNMTQLTTYFENMKPGTTYYIGLTLDVSGILIYSDWQVVETKCHPVKNFDITPEENGIIIDLQIDTQLYSCPANWYSLEIRNIVTNEIIVSALDTVPYKLQNLSSYTSFDVIAFHKNRKLFSQEICTLEGVPSRVIDLQYMLSANTEVTLIWKPPRKPNGKIVRYEIILTVVEYYGCSDLKLPTPNNHNITKFTIEPTVTISDLRSYALYSAQVIVHNSRYFSISAMINFKTAESEIPSEIFSNLTLKNWKLLWEPPKDCTTISGTLRAKIKIRGISEAVQHFYVTKKTTYSYLNLDEIKLNGVERYEATIYVIRNYMSKENTSAYQKYEFETPPKAPPKVTNLEIVEIDTREVPDVIIHLRWQNPLPPLNGKLHGYGVQLCNTHNTHCLIVKVRNNEFCDLWDNYICKLISKKPSFSSIIKVFAYNINVTEPGDADSVSDYLFQNTKPDAPGNFSFTLNNNSVVDLKWIHPWKTGGHLRCFRIGIKKLFSNLRRRNSRSTIEMFEYPVTKYTRNYTERLYLFPSTQYVISIQAVTIANKSSTSQFVVIHTPSTTVFDGILDVMVDKSDSTVLLNIPNVLNDTQDSVMHIIVKGPTLCEQYSKVPENLRARAGIKMNEIAWQAAKISTKKLAGGRFRIGDNGINDNVRNCLLKPEETYEIVIIVTEQNSTTQPIMLTKTVYIGEVPSKNHKVWIIFIIILLLAVVGAAFYFYRRKRQKLTDQLMQDEIVLSQNIENYEQETKFVISNSKQDLSTPSDKQSLSRTTTPEVLNINVNDDEREQEITSLVKVKDFEDYVRRAIETKLLDKQYETFPRGQTRSWDYGKLPQNKSKNRYGNLIAYDDTRVILKKLPGDDYSDYINANYITGYKKEKRYIATQGPKSNTIIDFWRMIWQENVLIICMLANLIENGKTKCEQYWPDIGKRKKYGNVVVLNAKHNVFADYCVRTFKVTCGEETRQIEHLHYTAWPDHGVPMYTHSVVTYLKKLLATSPGNGPVVVHCSAGVGRTGTIILCDICLHRAAAEGMIDVFAETASIRSERANMVDNKQQYLLAHLALVECLLSVPTTLPCNETLLTRIKELKKQLPIQQQRLQNTAWQDEALRPIMSFSALSKRNKAKNRFPELITDKINRIYLKRYPASNEDSDYLSAVYVDGVRLQNQYLATQLPMPSTINDFWRMIAEFKVELILMLQPPDLQDPTCCAIAPASGEFKPVPYLNITAEEIVELEYYTLQKLSLIDNSEKPSREQFITILCMTKWKPGKDQPPPPVMMMVTFWQAAERIARGDGPAVTVCHDGVTGCGLYLALAFLLERMAVERECDVCLAVRAIRRSRPDFVRSLEHLEYLYDAAVAYLEYFETYANFS